MERVSQDVIVIADDDPTLLELLHQLLATPTRVVDLVFAAEGLSVDAFALSQPSVVVLNPRCGGLSDKAMAELIAQVRTVTSARIVLMVGDDDDSVALTRTLGADTGVALRTLLRNPLVELAQTFLPVVPDAAVQTLPQTEDLSVEVILELELVPEAIHTSPAAPAPKHNLNAQARAASAAIDILALIDDELLKFDQLSDKPQGFERMLNTMSEDTLWGVSAQDMRGVFISSYVLPKIGQAVVLDVRFPWNESFTWRGQVSWTTAELGLSNRKKTGFGVTLDTLDADARRVMARLNGLRAPILVLAEKVAPKK